MIEAIQAMQVIQVGEVKHLSVGKAGHRFDVGEVVQKLR